jgi:folate-dependent phosphoribosylglycinamide formyltransferase PurN
MGWLLAQRSQTAHIHQPVLFEDRGHICLHDIVDEGVDTGPVLRQIEVAVASDDTEGTLHDKIKVIERPLLVATVAEIARGEINIKEHARA